MQKQTEKNTWQRWFVNDYHVVAGRPKMEDALMNYARTYFLHRTVYERDIKDLVSNIKAAQRKYLEMYRRWKEVHVRLNGNILSDDLVWLAIGEQNLTLRRVKEEIEVIDPQFPYWVEV